MSKLSLCSCVSVVHYYSSGFIISGHICLNLLACALASMDHKECPNYNRLVQDELEWKKHHERLNNLERYKFVMILFWVVCFGVWMFGRDHGISYTMNKTLY